MTARPRRNRVTPFGTLEAVPEKGRFLGNRGDLLSRRGELVRSWKERRWITCTLTPIGAPVTFDRPGCYTPLFFADEAVAFAAGHRPCAQCRRADFRRFRTGWQVAQRLDAPSSAVAIDAVLHAARLRPDGGQATWTVPLATLPDGVFVTLRDAPGEPLLLSRGALHPWNHGGYGSPRTVPAGEATVLTPPPIVAVFAAGYVPQVAIPS